MKAFNKKKRTKHVWSNRTNMSYTINKYKKSISSFEKSVENLEKSTEKAGNLFIDTFVN